VQLRGDAKRKCNPDQCGKTPVWHPTSIALAIKVRNVSNGSKRDDVVFRLKSPRASTIYPRR